MRRARIEEAVPAVICPGVHEPHPMTAARTLKSSDRHVEDRPQRTILNSNPAGMARSDVFSEAGLREAGAASALWGR